MRVAILNLQSAIGWDYTLNASLARVNPPALRLAQLLARRHVKFQVGIWSLKR